MNEGYKNCWSTAPFDRWIKTPDRCKMSANVPPLKYTQNENDETDSLLVRDVSQYLLMLAKMNANPNTGNALLSEALSAITKALKPYSTYHASELPRILNHVKSDNSYSPSSRKEKFSYQRI